MNEEEFWQHFELGPKGCLNWTGAKDARGYGLLWFGGKNWWVHRLAYTLTYGSVPQGKDVHHSCENKTCGRPDHLIALSHREHPIEYLKKDGLTPAQLSEIRHSTAPPKVLVAKFGRSRSEIYQIRTGRRYAWVDFLRKDVLAA